MNQEPSQNKPADVGTALAHERTDIALKRTRWAAERTLMAWIRTSLSMISFGFSILKFFEFLQSSQQFKMPEGMIHLQGRGSRNVGLTLIAIGTCLLVPAVIDHWRSVKELSLLDGKSPWSLGLVVACLMGGTGLVMFISSLFRWAFFS